MQENAIKQRVRMIENLWEAQVRLPENKNARVCCFMGQGTVDYRMIKGFLMVQLSEESMLPDIFMLTHEPFKKESNYPQKIIGGIEDFVCEWNNEVNSSEDKNINWTPTFFDEKTEQGNDWFVHNLNTLADALDINEGAETLTLALFPEPNYSPFEFAEWLKEVAVLDSLSGKLRFLIFDLYESKVYEGIEKRLGTKFLRLYPDLDMPGAMSQIAEQMEATAENDEKRAIASFQKNLLELNKAIGVNDEKAVIIYRAQCLDIATKWNWLSMAAIVHFFSHGFYTSIQSFEKAEMEINKAITTTEEDLEHNKDADKNTLVHYLITKGNMHFIRKNFEKAVECYQKALDITREINAGDTIVLNGIYQMLALALYNAGDPELAFSIFEEGWTIARKDPEYFESELAKLYAGEMRKKGMHSKLQYRQLFAEIEEKWGILWFEEIPKTAEQIERTGLNNLNKSVPSEAI